MAWLEESLVVVVVLLALAWAIRRLFLWWRRMRAFGKGDDASPCVACSQGGPSACRGCSLVDDLHKPNFTVHVAADLSGQRAEQAPSGRDNE